MNDQINATMARTMLQLQDEVNTQINPNWRLAGNPWYRAIWTECAELADHIGWKWWKKQHPNISQVQLELVDIWHFGLSDILEKTQDYDAAMKSLEPAFKIFLASSVNMPPSEFGMNLIDVETFAADTLINQRFDSQLFAKLAITSRLSLEDIFVQYVGKNVLNRFRQDNGYKIGTYIKIWNGREDNEWLVELLQQVNPQLPSFTEDLYQVLAVKYAEVKC